MFEITDHIPKNGTPVHSTLIGVAGAGRQVKAAPDLLITHDILDSPVNMILTAVDNHTSRFELRSSTISYPCDPLIIRSCFNFTFSIRQLRLLYSHQPGRRDNRNPEI